MLKDVLGVALCNTLFAICALRPEERKMAFEIFLKKVGENIAAIRKSKWLKQKEVAELAQISYRYYQSIEAGAANLTLSTLFRLANFFDVPPVKILSANTTPSRKDPR
jgi:DNA-binding XRE family transcriptional regulator